MNTKYRSFDHLPTVMTVEDLIPIIHIGRNSAYALVHSGKIKCVRVGKQIRIPRDALIAFLEDTH